MNIARLCLINKLFLHFSLLTAQQYNANRHEQDSALWGRQTEYSSYTGMLLQLAAIQYAEKAEWFRVNYETFAQACDCVLKWTHKSTTFLYETRWRKYSSYSPISMRHAVYRFWTRSGLVITLHCILPYLFPSFIFTWGPHDIVLCYIHVECWCSCSCSCWCPNLIFRITDLLPGVCQDH